jgi:hypothetical protein
MLSAHQAKAGENPMASAGSQPMIAHTPFEDPYISSANTSELAADVSAIFTSRNWPWTRQSHPMEETWYSRRMEVLDAAYAGQRIGL